MVWRGLAAMLDECHEGCRVSTASDYEELRCLIEPSATTLVILDLESVDSGDPETACREVLRMAADVRLVVMGSPNEPEAMRRSLSAGALGCVGFNSTEATMTTAFRLAFDGEEYIDPLLAPALIRGNRDRSSSTQISNLTPREKDVLRLLAEGFSNREVSARLFISEKTTKGHVSSILAKLQVTSRLAAAVMAQEVLR